MTDAALTKVRIYSADGTFTDKNLLDPVTTGTQMRSVSLRFNEATNRLYIFGISGVGDYSFSSPTGTKTLTAMNNDLFILILDNQGNLLNVASMLGSNGTDSEVGGASPQEDAAGSFYIFGKNAGKGVVIKMSGTAAVDGSDIEHIATFTGVTNFGGVAPIDNSNFFALGKDSATSKTFVAKISNVTYASTGTILNFDTATVPRALDYTNGSIYAIMDFTGATTAIPSTPATTANNPNAGGLNSILIASIANYDTTATLATKVIGNTGGATSFNAYFKEKNRDVMVIGGTYTGNGDL